MSFWWKPQRTARFFAGGGKQLVGLNLLLQKEFSGISTGVRGLKFLGNAKCIGENRPSVSAMNWLHGLSLWSLSQRSWVQRLEYMVMTGKWSLKVSFSVSLLWYWKMFLDRESRWDVRVYKSKVSRYLTFFTSPRHRNLNPPFSFLEEPDLFVRNSRIRSVHVKCRYHDWESRENMKNCF